MDIYREIIYWIRDTFGEKRDPDMIMEHLWEEMEELDCAASRYGMNKTADNASDLLSEYADVQILLWNLMDNYGFCKNRQADGVVLKHSINRKRKWELKDGKMKHKK